MVRRREKGFTLIEIMLVVIIIGVLAAMIIPNFAGRGEQAKRSAARADIEANLSTGLDLYEMDMGSYPPGQEGLRALLERPTSVVNTDQWRGPYLKKKRIPLDPWGRPYVYVFPGVHDKDSYDLFSYGSDGVESQDDITNWAGTIQGANEKIVH